MWASDRPRYAAAGGAAPEHSHVLCNPIPGHLPRGDVETVPEIREGDRDHQRTEIGLGEMSRSFLPYLVRYRIRSVAEPRGGLRERERGALGLRVVRGLTPCRESEDPCVALTELLERATVHVDADAAP